METVNPSLRAIWERPNKLDVMEYNKKEILKKISPPIPCRNSLRLTFYFRDEIFQTIIQQRCVA